MMKKAMLLLVLTLLIACVLQPAMAESWDDGLPEEFAGAFIGEEWEGFDCVAGYSFYPPGENTSPGVPAFAVMERGEENELCILQCSEVNIWEIVVKSGKALYQGDQIPFIADEDDYGWFHLQYVNEDGTREKLGFFREDDGQWYFSGYWKYTRYEEPMSYISIAAKIWDTALTRDVLLVTKVEDGVYLYQDRPVQSIIELDLRYFDFSAFPKAPEDISVRTS